MEMLRKHEEDEFVKKVGGRFRLASLLEKRYRELLFGARPMVDAKFADPLDLLLAEVMEGKIDLIPEAEAIAAAASMLMADRSDEAREELALRAKLDARVLRRDDDDDEKKKVEKVEKHEADDEES